MTTRREHDRLRDPDDYPTESEIGDMRRQLDYDRERDILDRERADELACRDYGCRP